MKPEVEAIFRAWLEADDNVAGSHDRFKRRDELIRSALASKGKRPDVQLFVNGMLPKYREYCRTNQPRYAAIPPTA